VRSVIRIFPLLGVINVKLRISRTILGSDCVSDPLKLTEDLLLLKIMLIPSTLSLWDDREDSFPSNRSSNSPTMKNLMSFKLSKGGREGGRGGREGGHLDDR
jgi:hypothetical protein